MGLTPNHQLPYPEPGDPPDVPVDMYELANRLDAIIATVPLALERRIAELEARVAELEQLAVIAQ